MKRYLLDTHLVYWWMTDDATLGEATRGLIAEGDVSVSVASIWEMALKNARGKLPLPDAPIAEGLQAQAFRVLAISARHVEATRRLNWMHDDPFDRLLVATAETEGLTLLTRDAAILKGVRAAGFRHVQST